MQRQGPLLLAGGGHSHALLLKRWAMHPQRRPQRSIVLVSRHSTALYSGMVPGLIAGIYQRDQLAIDLRQLCDRAGVAFVQAEIQGLDAAQQQLLLQDRPALAYGLLSLNLGAITATTVGLRGIPIKPLEPALAFLDAEDPHSPSPFRVVGSGAAAVEVILALRRRWPRRPLQLQVRRDQPDAPTRRRLATAAISLVADDNDSPWNGPSLLCTGSAAPRWLATSGLPSGRDGRVLTDACLQVQHHPQLFASGDCAVISTAPRPASGVWAVRAAAPLARNLEAACADRPLQRWHPQGHALQLIGDQSGLAWAHRGRWHLGASRLLWALKQRIDQRFMAGFAAPTSMAEAQPMACRGCAAKLPAQPLAAALQQVGLSAAAEDAAVLADDPTRLQSVDGFPALLSDPWLNGRLTALHACSDLWASGADVTSAMAVVTLPLVPPDVQQQLLAQTLAGVQAVLIEQGATLIGGHTLEARSAAPTPASLGIQVSLSVNGRSPAPWSKGGIQPGDALLLSRALGTGVLFAAAMAAAAEPAHLDAALDQMQRSQHHLLAQLQSLGPGIHACTDITGFGLLGHLGEMLQASAPLQIELITAAIPAYAGALGLLNRGHASSLAPANRKAWQWLDGPVRLDQPASPALLELLVDPQTCGPLLLACRDDLADRLMALGPWTRIGTATAARG